jgi:alpha-tubulin suppressor-like RCC1 family protein
MINLKQDVGDLFMWGKNSQGNLGIGHEEDQFFPYRVCFVTII